MHRFPLARRTIAASVLVLLGTVLGIGALHLHPHGGPTAATQGWSGQEEGSGQAPGSCLLCRFAQQPITAEAVLAHAARPVTVPVAVETGLAEEPRQAPCTSALPRAPPAASAVS